jgi:hypothetical protein
LQRFLTIDRLRPAYPGVGQRPVSCGSSRMADTNLNERSQGIGLYIWPRPFIRGMTWSTAEQEMAFSNRDSVGCEAQSCAADRVFDLAWLTRVNDRSATGFDTVCLSITSSSNVVEKPTSGQFTSAR